MHTLGYTHDDIAHMAYCMQLITKLSTNINFMNHNINEYKYILGKEKERPLVLLTSKCKGEMNWELLKEI